MSPARRPAAVFFDLGQVLCRFDWQPSLHAIAARLQGVTPDVLTSWLLDPAGPHDAYCRGRIDEDGLLEAIHRRFDPDRHLPDAWLIERWCTIFRPMDGAMELVDRLGGQCRRGLISNTNRLHFEWLDSHFGIRGRLEAIVVSHEVGSLKPSRAIYDAALRSANVTADEAFYVDDIPAYVEAARTLGWRGTVFTGVGSLARRLRRLGFLV
jgi:FMN phosphatase YigB (HAD superfamily)